MSKYYTPKIEEFHVGFMYEYKSGINWIPMSFSFDILRLYPESPTKNETRVKYLDSKDIESLGLTLKITEAGQDTKEYPDIYIENTAIGSYFEDDEMNIQLYTSFYKIKNRSEFQKLMKQLGL